MAQNIYDQADFFAGYSKLPRSVDGLASAPEWPTLKAMLPDIRGLKVLDLGCGFGWFCRWAAEHGALEVLGLDISQNMLERARAETSDKAVFYATADLEQLTLSTGAFDLVYSSLAFHYVEDAARLYATIHNALVEGGCLVFSTEHPVFMASNKQGWLTTEDGRQIWPVDRYSVEGRRTTDWFTPGVVKYHRTIATTLNLLIRSGFRIEQIEEFCPSAEQIAETPNLAKEIERPMFLLVSARR